MARSLYFAAGNAFDQRSSIWMVHANKRDIYVAAALAGNIAKASMHESGVCRLAYTAESGLPNPESPTGDRVMLRWREHVLDENASLLLHIIVPPVSSLWSAPEFPDSGSNVGFIEWRRSNVE